MSAGDFLAILLFVALYAGGWLVMDEWVWKPREARSPRHGGGLLPHNPQAAMDAYKAWMLAGGWKKDRRRVRLEGAALLVVSLGIAVVVRWLAIP